MEKYTQFRDKATGISPFMPVQPSSSFINPLVFIVRCLVVIPLLPLTLIHRIFIKLILLICGLSYDISVQGIKSRDTYKFHPVKNEVYFVNFTSLMDYLMLLILSNDSFVVLIPDEQGCLYKYDFIGFIYKALGHESNGSHVSIKELTNKVVYIFAEGTTTNGKSIIPFTISDSQWSNFYKELCHSHIFKIKTMSLKLYPSHLTSPLPMSLSTYIYRLLSTLQLSIKIRINFVQDNTLQKIKNAIAYKYKLVEGVGLKEKKQFIKVYKH